MPRALKGPKFQAKPFSDATACLGWSHNVSEQFFGDVTSLVSSFGVIESLPLSMTTFLDGDSVSGGQVS